MPHPIAPTPADDAMRRLAGHCYLALRTGDGNHLSTRPTADVLRRSGLAGIHSNLCERLGVETDRTSVIQGLGLVVANRHRWESLLELLALLEAEGIRPVLFKGGALHARWPQMLDLRVMSDYDLMVPQAQVERLRRLVAQLGYESLPASSWLTQRLSKGLMVWSGSGFEYQNLDIHARVTEPPVCDSLTRSMLASGERGSGVRIPDIEDCVCMIALHVVRSGMHRPLQEYIDLLWYVDGMNDAQWRSLRARAVRHHLAPALFLSLRQAVHCLALDELAPEQARMLAARIAELRGGIGRLRMHALDWLAPPDYPLHPLTSRNRPAFRRSLILGAGTGSLWRVGAAFVMYGAARFGDGLSRAKQEGAAAA